MKHDMNTTKAAVFFLLPPIKEAFEKGVHFNFPELLKIAAEKQFVDIILDREKIKSFDERMAEFIVAEALHDLNTQGWMMPGEKTYEFN